MAERTWRSARWALFAAGSLLIAGAAQAQPAPRPDPDDVDVEVTEDVEVEELVVVAAGGPPIGSAIGDIPPEITLDAREIRALGASSVAELLEALEPQIGSSRGRGGRPVTLVNGARISSFAEIRDLPPEAILRVDILPEEVALKYGYRADQRVVNFVLRRRFRATTVEAGARVATAGGRESYDADVNQLRIQRDTRLQLDLKVSGANALLESERDVLRTGGAPASLSGNVTAPSFGAEIDPALSALAGQPLTAVGIPAGAPTLAGFAATPFTTTDEAPYRTLLRPQTQAALNAILSRPLGDGVSLTLNGTLEASEIESWLGLPRTTLIAPAGGPFSPFAGPVAVQRFARLEPLTRTLDSWGAHFGMSMRGAVSGWQWTLTANADRSDNQTITERGLDVSGLQAAVNAGTVNPFAAAPADLLLYRPLDLTHSVVTSGDADLLFTGALFELPAGEVRTSVTAGLDARRVESSSLRSGLERSVELSRGLGRLQGNVDVPIASRRNGTLEALGNLSLNFNAEVAELSDFGTLWTVGAGVNWSPIEPLRIIASVTQEDGAPTIQQLGDPEIETPNVRVFDYVLGRTVEVTRIEGGNPALQADSRRVFKLGLTWKPWDERDLTFRADWTRSRTENLIASFPEPTAEIEQAFPGRIIREGGQLVRIDVRPVNFDRQAREEVRWGFNYSRPLRNTRPPPGFEGRFAAGGQAAPGDRRRQREAQGQPPAGAQPAQAGQAPQAGQTPPGAGAEGGGRRFPGGGGPGGGRFGPGGGFGGRGGGFGGGSIQVGLFHTLRLQDEIVIRPGLAPLDFLGGSAAGGAGGQPRHQVDLQAAVNRNGLGARLTARWQSATEVRGLLGGQDLRFSETTRVNLRLFADLGQQPFARRHTWLRGARLTLTVDNLFDSRQEVRDATGATPLNFQPDLLDPLGRTVRVSFRKVFF
ncbi:TonB-dependent receptor [Phenylobacterium sp.]|uniref:TonB-dependent receptor n=1 Tax=Phenylobacterium sp. TaxID=1871053 RepID=UPI002F92FC46